MGNLYSKLYSSVSSLSCSCVKDDVNYEMNTEHVHNKFTNISKVLQKRKSSYNFTKGNFVYLKEKDILKEYKFEERIGQGLVSYLYKRFFWISV